MSVELAPLQVRRTVFIPPTLRFAAVSVIGPPASAQYLPPVLSAAGNPLQTIISLPVHTAVCSDRAVGAFVVVVAVQLFVPGLYLPPVLKGTKFSFHPPQTIISLPIHTAVWPVRAVGALVVLVAVQLFVPGLYLPPVFSTPPQTI